MFEHFTSDESEDNRIERASLRACVLACVRASRPTTIYDSSHATILASAIFSARCRTEWLHMVAIMGLEKFFELTDEFGAILGSEVAAASPAAYALRGTTYFLVVVCVI